MRKLIFFLLPILFSFANIKVQAQKTDVQKSTLSSLNGGWNRIEIRVEGKPVNNTSSQFRVFNDGYFSMIGQDSTGAYKVTYGGTYELDGNIYKEKMLYSSSPDYIGTMHWQEFELKGDTLIFRTAKKVLDPPRKRYNSHLPQKRNCLRKG